MPVSIHSVDPLSLDVDGLLEVHNLRDVVLALLVQVTEPELDGRNALTVVGVQLIDPVHESVVHLLLLVQPLAEVAVHAEDLLQQVLVARIELLDLLI